MKAGVDVGTSTTKVAMREDDGRYRFFSSSDDEDGVAERLVLAGVTRLRTVGIGGSAPEGFAVSGPAGDPIEDEIALQASGVRTLLGEQDGPSGDFLLVSIGTGTSYTLVPKDGPARRFPVGNAIGGGSIAGLAAMQVVHVSDIDGHASRGSPLDLLVKDLVPTKAGTFEGELVVSHFGKMGLPRFLPDDIAEDADPIDDICASIVHCAAVTVIRDVMILGMIPGFSAEDVVFIGTPVAKMASLRAQLAKYAAMLGKQAHFPERGEYAAALGALDAD